MSATQSIDDKINGIKPRDFEPVERKAMDQPEAESEVHEEDRASEEAPKEREIKQEKSTEEKPTKEISEKSDAVKSESNISDNSDDEDEYGNKVEKSKTYTQEEVERMMRERLARVRHDATQQVSQPQTQPPASQTTADGEDAWQQELGAFVDNRLSALEQRKATEQFQKQEQAKQAEFQAKFSMGMEKYKDFHATVENMPITDAMMMATRDMKDPAAFIYAASKLHPGEVQRIASIPDKFTQAAEVGRLEEKMRKAKNISKTAKPLSQTKGDISASYVPKQSIEDKIAKHAKAKRR